MKVAVNLFGGTGAGKSTAAHGLMFLLKCAGYSVEFSEEVAKGLVPEERFDILTGNQALIFSRQMHRLNRRVGKADVVITDAPLPMCIDFHKHDRDPKHALAQIVMCAFDSYPNLNIHLLRDPERSYHQEGRYQDAAGALQTDADLKNTINSLGIKMHLTTITKGNYLSDIGELIKQVLEDESALTKE